jgi:hypothetical protein
MISFAWGRGQLYRREIELVVHGFEFAQKDQGGNCQSERNNVGNSQVPRDKLR